MPGCLRASKAGPQKLAVASSGDPIPLIGLIEYIFGKDDFTMAFHGQTPT